MTMQQVEEACSPMKSDADDPFCEPWSPTARTPAATYRSSDSTGELDIMAPYEPAACQQHTKQTRVMEIGLAEVEALPAPCALQRDCVWRSECGQPKGLLRQHCGVIASKVTQSGNE